MRAVFERFDRNRNNRLEHAELREALGPLATPPHPNPHPNPSPKPYPNLGSSPSPSPSPGAFDSKHGRLEVSSREAAAKLAKYDRDKSGAMEIDEFALLVADLRRLGYEIRDAEIRRLGGGGGSGEA